MTVFLGVVLGYLIGTRTGGRDIEQLGRSLKALCQTEEFADVVAAARAGLAGTLQELASVVDGDGQGAPGEVTGPDLVARVRQLVDHR